jgi:glutamate racemase
VAKRILELLPRESIAYVADQIHVPYGERSPEEIRSFALGISDFLIGKGAKLVIMACNMSSATALDAARELHPDTPIIGVIEAGTRAALRASAGPIGVLATTGTVSTRAYTRALAEMQVFEQACPRFVPIVEQGMCESRDAESAAREYVTPLLRSGCRAIILGCTHFPYLARAIRKAAGSEIAIIDPAEETAREAANILLDSGMLNPPHAEPVHAYFTTGKPDQFADLGTGFMGTPISSVSQISWGLELRALEWQEKTVERTINSAR